MSRFAPPSLLLVLVLSGSMLVSSPAHAWMQTMTCLDEEPDVPTRTPYCQGDQLPMGFHWPEPTMVYSVNRHGSQDVGDGIDISTELLNTVQRSLQTWNEPECSVFQFEYGGLTDTRDFLPEDGENVIVFHDDEWPYSSGALALTSVTADPKGVIINADMEINGVDHVFASGDGDESRWDIENTVTHEAGHMLGLDHSAVKGSTMEFNAEPGETKKRDLHPDDIEGLCTIYDPENFVAEEEPEPKVTGGCCAVVDDSAQTGWLGLVALVLTFARRRFPR